MATINVPPSEVDTFLDSNSQQIAVVEYEKRRVELGGLNNGGEAALLTLKDGHGRQLFRLNAATGNLTVGGLNPEQGQDGDVILKDQNGREIIRLSAGNAKLTAGGGNTPGLLELQDTTGAAVVTLDGAKRDVTAGGNGDGGRLMAADADGQVTAGLDGAQSALLLRAPNGTVFKVTVDNNGALTTTAL